MTNRIEALTHRIIERTGHEQRNQRPACCSWLRNRRNRRHGAYSIPSDAARRNGHDAHCGNSATGNLSFDRKPTRSSARSTSSISETGAWYRTSQRNSLTAAISRPILLYPAQIKRLCRLNRRANIGVMPLLRRLASADFCIAIRGPKVSPIHIWPQVFAADGAVCGSLDGRAMIGRNISTPQPVMHDLRLDADTRRQHRLVSTDCDCFVDCFHNGNSTRVLGQCQHVAFATINNCCSVSA
jgi:hypothetical protein